MSEPTIRRKFQYTDLKNNNNKWWMLEWWPDGKLVTTYGRVGYTAPSTEKTGITQSKAESIINTKIREGYVEIDLHKVSANPVAPVNTGMFFDSTASKYVNDLLAEAGEYIKSYLSVGINSLSVDQIKKGRSILLKLALTSDPDEKMDLAEQFYKAIPTQLPSKIIPEEVVRSLTKDLHEQEDRLDQLEAAIATATPSPAGSHTNPLSATQVEFIPSSDPAYIEVQKYLKESSSSRIIDMLRVTIPTERAAFDNSTIGKHNVTKLWHGTANKNGVHILRKGLIIPAYAANGSRFGRGIYFADKAKKSINYTGYTSKFFRMLFICDVALGRMWKSGGQDAYMTSAKPGYDSTWGDQSWGGMDEFIVYKPEQQTIKAIVFVER